MGTLGHVSGNPAGHPYEVRHQGLTGAAHLYYPQGVSKATGRSFNIVHYLTEEIS
jgi:hypothetical protein